VSLALLLASRLVGLARESAQAAAFGSTALADIAVLMLTLPDWITGVVASGALAYVLMPAWAGQPRAPLAAVQRQVAWWLMAGAAILVLALVLLRYPVLRLLVSGLPREAIQVAAGALVWSALAVPAAFLAALWATRLQHERDFLGLYAGNLIVNGALIAAVALVGWQALSPATSVVWLGWGLLGAMGLRLVWLLLRLRPLQPAKSANERPSLPPVPLWLWAALSAGLPLALPFAARSIASQGGEGALATFNYAWKLVELPLLLAIQLVTTLAFPAIAQAFSQRAVLAPAQLAVPIRHAFALAWTLACAAAAALLLAAPAIAQLLFGWGRMDAAALDRVGIGALSPPGGCCLNR
jgi:peptidoglycan biosynthesis protein MviN/MurJ (putative lipid II flippase)